MSSSVVTYRFPNGDKEFRAGEERAPLVGELLRRGNDVWFVAQITEGNDGSALVTLAPFEPPESVQIPGSPSRVP